MEQENNTPMGVRNTGTSATNLLFVDKNELHVRKLKLEDIEFEFGMKPLTGADEDRILEGGFEMKGRSHVIQTQLVQVNISRLVKSLSYIKAHMPDGHTEDIPVTRENITKMRASVQRFLLDEIGEMNSLPEGLEKNSDQE